MNREQRRALGKKLGKDVTSSLDMMINLPTECLTCKKPYDKKDKQMANTWFVEAIYKEKKTNLYCPECFKKRENAD